MPLQACQSGTPFLTTSAGLRSVELHGFSDSAYGRCTGTTRRAKLPASCSWLCSGSQAGAVRRCTPRPGMTPPWPSATLRLSSGRSPNSRLMWPGSLRSGTPARPTIRCFGGPMVEALCPGYGVYPIKTLAHLDSQRQRSPLHLAPPRGLPPVGHPHQVMRAIRTSPFALLGQQRGSVVGARGLPRPPPAGTAGRPARAAGEARCLDLSLGQISSEHTTFPGETPQKRMLK